MEKIYLTRETITGLYKKNLVIVEAENNKQEDNSGHSVLFTGGYRRNILWVHNEPNHPFLSNEDHEMVTKILSACALSWQDIALVNTYESAFSLIQIFDQLKPTLVIVSSQNHDELMSHNENLYEVRTYNNMNLVCTDPLGQIRNDKNLIVQLWQGLKQLFNL